MAGCLLLQAGQKLTQAKKFEEAIVFFHVGFSYCSFTLD